MRFFVSALALIALQNMTFAQNPAPPAPTAERTTKVYPVADLVDLFSIHKGLGQVSESVRCANGAAVAAKCSSDCCDLARVLSRCVEPGSWGEFPGGGQITFLPKGQSLLVVQTPEVHARIERYLAALRHDLERQVVLQVRLIQVSEKAFERISTFESLPVTRQSDTSSQWLTKRCVTLSETEVRFFLEDLNKDKETQVLTCPNCTMLDGQIANIMIGSSDSSIAWKMQPRISADSKYVAVGLHLNWEGKQLETTLCAPSGSYCMIGGKSGEWTQFGPPVLNKIPYINRLFKNTGSTNAPWVALVKVSVECNADQAESHANKVLAQALAEVPEVRTTGEEAATISPPAKAESIEDAFDQAHDAYLKACLRGDLKQIKKWHKVLSKLKAEIEFEREADAFRSEQKLSQLQKQLEIDSVKYDFTVDKSIDAELRHQQWTERWQPTPTPVQMKVTVEEIPVGFAKPGPGTFERIGVDFETVETKVDLKGYRVTVGTGLRIAVPQLGPMPINIDLGLPVVQPSPSENKQIFSFWNWIFN